MRTVIAVVSVAVWLITACAPQGVRSAAAAKKRNFAVELKPKTSGPDRELEIKSGPKGYGKSSKKNGYVGFDVDEAGSIIFHIRKEDVAVTCEDESDPDWVITEVALSDDGVASTEKGNNFDVGQSPWLQLAFPAVDLTDGVVYESDWDEATTTVAIFDANAHQGQKDIYYRVTATECEENADGDHETLTTDPMVRNRGK